MKRFMVIGYTTQEAYAEMKNMTKEQGAEMMNGWFAWKDRLGEKVIDMGSPLMNGATLSSEGKKVATEKEVSGYMMIQAGDMDEAFKLIEESPMGKYRQGNTYEIYECFDMNE